MNKDIKNIVVYFPFDTCPKSSFESTPWPLYADFKKKDDVDKNVVLGKHCVDCKKNVRPGSCEYRFLLIESVTWTDNLDGIYTFLYF